MGSACVCFVPGSGVVVWPVSALCLVALDCCVLLGFDVAFGVLHSCLGSSFAEYLRMSSGYWCLTVWDWHAQAGNRMVGATLAGDSWIRDVRMEEALL